MVMRIHLRTLSLIVSTDPIVHLAGKSIGRTKKTRSGEEDDVGIRRMDFEHKGIPTERPTAGTQARIIIRKIYAAVFPLPAGSGTVTVRVFVLIEAMKGATAIERTSDIDDVLVRRRDRDLETLGRRRPQSRRD